MAIRVLDDVLHLGEDGNGDVEEVLGAGIAQAPSGPPRGCRAPRGSGKPWTLWPPPARRPSPSFGRSSPRKVPQDQARKTAKWNKAARSDMGGLGLGLVEISVGRSGWKIHVSGELSHKIHVLGALSPSYKKTSRKHGFRILFDSKLGFSIGARLRFGQNPGRSETQTSLVTSGGLTNASSF